MGISRLLQRLCDTVLQQPVSEAGHNVPSSFESGRSASAFRISAATGPGTPAMVEATTSGASYTGLAIDPITKQIYAANDKGTGSIDVFNSSFQRVSLGAGAFTDPNLPAGLVPFNVQEINGQLYVTYAPSSHAAQTIATAGMGAVAIFSTNGTFIKQVVSGGNLASPWGIALAPASFGQFHGDLLV